MGTASRRGGPAIGIGGRVTQNVAIAWVLVPATVGTMSPATIQRAFFFFTFRNKGITGIMFSINPKFRDRLTKLDKDQLTALREDIQAAGHVRDPLVVWASPSGKEFLVDGHHRWGIIQELEIGFATRKLDFKTEDEVLLWIDRNQYARRNATEGEMSILRARIYAQRKAEHGGDRKSSSQNENLIEGGKETVVARKTADVVAQGDCATLGNLRS